MKIKTFTAAFLVAAFLIGCGESTPPAGNTTASTASQPQAEKKADDAAQAPAPEQNQFSVDGFTMKKGEFGEKSAVGTITNNTDSEFKYVQVEINLYDKDGAQVGSTMANINNLAPKAKWKFSAPIIEDGVTKAEIKDIQGM